MSSKGNDFSYGPYDNSGSDLGYLGQQRKSKHQNQSVTRNEICLFKFVSCSTKTLFLHMIFIEFFFFFFINTQHTQQIKYISLPHYSNSIFVCKFKANLHRNVYVIRKKNRIAYALFRIRNKIILNPLCFLFHFYWFPV